jgi:RNA polymerase sigma-70 factor (ECF subfamily)
MSREAWMADAPDAHQPLLREEPHTRALLNAARAGNREAFGDLVTQHHRVVFRTALTVLGSREEAEDAAQDAFVTAWQKLGGFRGDATFRTWLLTIVWRKALDRRRVLRLRLSRVQQAGWQNDDRDAPRDPIDALQTSEPSPEVHAVSRDLSRRVRAEIGRLAPKLRDTLLLAASGEHTYEEIAAMLAIPLGTVKWRVAEARRILNSRLAPMVTR